MSDPKRQIIAVVTARANGYAEKELLGGIISENTKNGCATVVFSNIYNMVQRDDDLMCEQRIYSFVHSPDISGIILLCESFVEENIRERIASVLADTNVPIVGIGTRLAEFDSLNYTLLSTDDVADMEELTSHLIEKHGFTDIVLLTGMEQIETSQLRVEGYYNALRAHGIAPDKNKVFYGDFWFSSGEQLADRYISGEQKTPQAVICANDIMAYGMLRRFIDEGIHVPDELTVVSYDYSDIRIYYTPTLTSLRKDRLSLGTSAAKHLYCLITGKKPPEFIPPRGKFLFGNSCPCKADEAQSIAELRNAERNTNFNDLSLFSTMDHKLTLCRDMDEFINIISGYQWMIQNKENIYLCLYSDWNDTVSETTDIMRSVSLLDDHASFEMDHFDLSAFFEHNSGVNACYLNPLFSGQKLFGYMALLYTPALSYDDVYRHWLKSVSIGLEVLRLKNDIRYLISCQNISEYRDTLTGMNNKKGLRRAFQTIRIHGSRKLYFVMLRTDLFPNQFSNEEIRRKTEAAIGVSKAINKFCGNHDISGRVDDETFVCLVQSLAEPEILSDLMSAILLQESSYISYAGTRSFVCCAVPCEEYGFDELLAKCAELIKAEHLRLAALRRNSGYDDMLKVRNSIYSSPEITFEPDSENIFTERIGFFRRSYKNCFGITFHQDCINARIAKAKYYLATTSLGISDISDKCGYLDYKFFQRQFTANTGIPALRYRNLIKG